jgi:hypothetical protein
MDMNAHFAAILMVCFAFPSGLACAQNPKVTCDQKTAMEAEKEALASSVKNWDGLYQSFRRFSQCDDGSVGEGYSDTVEHLLAEDWQHFDRLVSLTSTDRQFQRFVLKHIDELWSPEHARAVSRNASQHCPPKGKRLCDLIIKRIAE